MSLRNRTATSPGDLLALIRSSPRWTRSQLVQASGASRVTVAERLDALSRAGLISVGTSVYRTGGRPAESVTFNAQNGDFLVADIGGSQTRVALTDLKGNVLASKDLMLDVSPGPDATLSRVIELFTELLSENGIKNSRIRGIGLGVPAPVDTHTGRLFRSPTNSDWADIVIPSFFSNDFPSAPVAVDKDANIMALGEYQTQWVDRHTDAVMLKVGMGIGCGAIVNGEVLHGAYGAAADVGHLSLGSDVVCRCGQTGCVDAVASGRAIAAELNAAGRSVKTSAEIVSLVSAKDPLALELVRAAGRQIGRALVPTISLLNPSLVVVGGNIADSPEPLLAGIRETVYSEAAPMSTQGLQIVPSVSGKEAGLRGAAMLIEEKVFSPEAVNSMITSGTNWS